MVRLAGTIQTIDVARQVMTDKGPDFHGGRRTRIEFVRRVTMPLNHVAHKSAGDKVGSGRRVKWTLSLSPN
jgi:hypothetical protein